MKKLLSILVTLTVSTMCVFNASANDAALPDASWAISITADNFADESEGVVWVEGGGNFDYCWCGSASEANTFAVTDSFKILIDGYVKDEVDSVSIQLGRLSFTAWNFVDQTKYYSKDADALKAPLTSDDFTDGQLVLNLAIPEGVKAAADYIDATSTAADSARLWTLQITGSSKTHDTYMNFVVDFKEGAASLRQLESVRMTVSPNPVKAGACIALDASAFAKDVAVKVYSLSGKVMLDQSIANTADASIAADFAPGIYTIDMTDGNKRAFQKLMVK